MGLRFAWAWNKSPYSVYEGDSNLWTSWPTVGQFNFIYTDTATIFTGPLSFSNFGSIAYNLVISGAPPARELTIPGATIDQGYFQGRFRFTRLGNLKTTWYLKDSSGAAKVTVATSGHAFGEYACTLTLICDGSAAATTTDTYAANNEYEIAISWDGTATPQPTAALYIDGSQVATATGTSGTPFSIQKLALEPHSPQSLYATDRWYMGGFTIWDSSSDDPTRRNIYVLPSLPTTDVTTTNWTSTGANFHDELADGSVSTYASSTTTPSTGNLEIGVQTRAQMDSGFTGGTIYGVGMQASTQGDGVLASVEVGLNSNGTTATTSGWTTSVSTGWAYHLSTVDPDTSSAWTGAAFDAVTTLFEGS